ILVNENDIVIAWDGANAGIVDFGLEGALGSTLGRLRLKEEIDSNLVNAHYVGYFLKLKENYIKDNTTGATIPHVSRGVLQNIEINLPSMSEQNKIVEILNKTVITMSLRQQQIEALSELKQSVFLDMFGDPNDKGSKFSKDQIGNLFEVQTGKTPKRGNSDFWEDGDIPWVKTTEVNNNKIKGTSEFITKKALEENNLKLFPKNTVFIAMYGQGKTRGQSALLTFPSTCNQACAAILPNDKYNHLFLWNQLLLQYEGLRALGRGGNQPNLNLNLVREFKVINPPIVLQEEYANIVEKIDKHKSLLSDSLKQMNTLYDSLLQKAFNGELFKEKKTHNGTKYVGWCYE